MASEQGDKDDKRGIRATTPDASKKPARATRGGSDDAASPDPASAAGPGSESPKPARGRKPRAPAADKGGTTGTRKARAATAATKPAKAGSEAAANTPAKPAARSAKPTKPATRRTPAKRAATKAPAKPAAQGRPADTRVGARKIAGHATPEAPRAETATATPAAAATEAAPPVPAGMDQLTDKMLGNLRAIEVLTQRLAAALTGRRPPNPAIEAPGPDFFAETSQAWLRMLAEHPGRIIEQQTHFWAETLKHYVEAQAALATGRLEAPESEPSTDRRFSNPLWHTHPYFSFIRRQYEIAAETMRRASGDLELADETQRRRVDWFTSQLIDMLAPTNFLATNPDALEKAVETEGESLVRGMENLVEDLEQHGGDLVVTLADRDAFEIGKNIATAPGEVVARRPLYELLQFSPTTEQVHAVPLILFPPWINKFYILDLKPQNSFIRWAVDQGLTLFVISWKNPGPEDAETGLDDYVQAYIDAMENVRIITGQSQVNAIGYCIGGTTLALTLALLKARGQEGGVNSATFFTTLTDFSDLGEFTPFIQEDFVNGIQAEVDRAGILSGPIMARTFSFLRANDLVWGPAIRSYMLGEPPPAFDLLFWNGDATNLPRRMLMEYLIGLCRDNRFAGDGYEMLGHTLRLSDVTLPVCSIACERDHIAPWKQCWKGLAQFGSRDKTFIMAESGHIAGIVSPPTRIKYGHYTSDAGFEGTPEDWLAAANRDPGSWWPDWGKWVSGRSGPMVPARIPETGIAPAPGTYVMQRALDV